MESEVGYADIITPEVQSALEEYLKDNFGDIAGVPIDYRFSGVMAYTRDGLPIVGEHPHFEEVYFALGFNGHGLGYGMRMAKHLVDCATTGLEPGLFSSKRRSLNAGEPIEEQGP